MLQLAFCLALLAVRSSALLLLRPQLAPIHIRNKEGWVSPRAPARQYLFSAHKWVPSSQIQKIFSQVLPCKSSPNESVEVVDVAQTPRVLAYGVVWLALTTYAFLFAPGGSAEAGAIDKDIIIKILSAPFDGSINPLFVALFNFLGIIPAVYAALLLPGAKEQKIPALPFVLSSFAFGYFGIGPYLGLRSIKTKICQSNKGLGFALFEFKGTALFLLGFALYLYYFAISSVFETDGGIMAAIKGFMDLFDNQRLANISSLDFTILSLAVSCNDAIIGSRKSLNQN